MNRTFCASCGNPVIQTIKICPKCGNRAFSSIPPSPSSSTAGPGQAASINSPTSSPLRAGATQANYAGISPGVKGWLLFFCISLTIIGPLIGVGSIANEWQQTKPSFESWPTLKNVVIFETIATSIFIALSFYTGMRLWQVKTGAVITAKRFLIAQLVYSLIAPAALAAILNMPGLIPALSKSAFQAVLYTAVWYPYLVKSKRVKATFP